ncbi:Fc.00g030220.m01.CDS01 [Cosmosporella sp. VM-42]
MEDTDYNPCAFANEMQLRTRKEKNFDEFERNLPDPKSPAMILPAVNIDGWLSRLANLNPWGKAVNEKDIVWLFDNTTYRSSRTGNWEAEFVAAVFEQDPKCKVVDIVESIAKTLGLAKESEECKTIEKRITPFLWDIQAMRVFRLDHQGRDLRLGPTSLNGITTNTLEVAHDNGGSLTQAKARVPRGVKGILDMQTYYAEPEGWGIISDIDDTIKLTMTSDPLGILRETFVNPPTPITGMPELYSEIQSILPEDTPWFYLSASPYNLYPLLRGFRDKFYPPGTMILRDSSWKTIAGLLSALTMGTEEYKVDRMKKVNSWLPERKMIVIGDSTQSDPEAYGELYRTVPGWINLILIRKATDVAAYGIDEKNEPERFKKAFKGIPREAWHVFEDPSECGRIVRDVVNRG